MSKYGNRKTEVNGITFDSAKEAGRYRELLLLLRAGAIQDLKLQPEFTLQEAFKTPEGNAVRPVRYRADFSYRKYITGEDGEPYLVTVVEDVKGFKTREYGLKAKLMEGKGIHVVEK